MKVSLSIGTRWAGVVFLLAIWPPASMQGFGPSSPDSGSHNCSHRYQLSLSPSPHESSCCLGSFVDSSPLISSNVDSCHFIMEILNMFNSVISEEDCMELVFMPGTYQLSSSLARVVVQYSVIMSAPEGGVTFTCAASQEPACACKSNEEGVNGTNNGRVIPMIMFEGGQQRNVFVMFDNIDFKYCTRHLEFISIDSLSVTNCKFVGFSASALDLFNVHRLEIHHTLFEDCRSNNASTQFRAHGGAVSVAYYQDQEASLNKTYPTLNINNCSFINNSAVLPEVFESDQINQALNNFYEGRGGALSIIPQDSYANVRGRIANSIFHQNRAQLLGGGTFFLITGNETSHEFVLENCTFLQNAVTSDFGGAIHVGLLQKNLASSPTKIALFDTRFEQNSADFGGGVSVVQVYSQGRGNIVVMENTHFVDNRAETVGSAIMFQTFAYVQSRFNIFFYNFTDCSFSGNVAPGGTLGAGFVNMNFFGTILFANNTGPALRMVGGLVTLTGKLSFLANTAPSNLGGALYIQEFGQLKLTPGAELEFINNTGRIGSAIVVDVQRSSPVFSELIYNPQCFLIHEDTTLPPGEWTDVSITFSGNVASIGPVVFISHLLHCSWFSAEQVDSGTNKVRIIFDVQNFPRWEAFHYDDTNKATSHSDGDPYDPKFYFQTQPVNFTSSGEIQKVRPGQTVPLKLVGIDQFGNPTYVIARVSDGRSNLNLGAFTQAVGSRQDGNISSQEQIQFEPALLPVQPNVGTVNISYGFTDSVVFDDLDDEDLIVPVVIDTPYNVIGFDALNFSITLANCQPGYQLRQANNLYTCHCTDTNFYILNCEEDVIILRDGLWAGAEMDVVPHLDHTVCPTPYCQCHTRSDQQSLCESLYYQDNSESRQQCHPTRNGTICGQCINGTGVGILRTNCRDCQDNSLFALGFLLVGDLLVIGFIMFCVIKLKLHFPHSLKGLLFYIQTVYYTTEHFPISFWDVRKYMLFVSSALGLYFPYDFCLYPHMPALVLFGLKFIPPAIALFMGVTVTVGAYVMRARDGRKHVWRGLWFLILLLYAPLFHNCVALLKCPRVPGSFQEDEERHWFYDGEVICFQDTGHIILSTIAIIVLFFLVVLSPALFIFTILAKTRKLKNRSLTMEWIVSALTEGYRDSLEATWWTSWELFRRLLLISIVVSLPGRSVTLTDRANGTGKNRLLDLAAAYVVIGAFAMHVFFKPYRKVFQNVIEIVVLLNYTILLLVRSTQTFLDGSTTLGYIGTAVPDFAGNGLPTDNTLIWLFLPFYYSPLVFAVIFCFGALIYRVIKSVIKRREKVVSFKEVESTGDEMHASVYINRSHEVTTTEIDGPSL